jgi:hypothetical protein
MFEKNDSVNGLPVRTYFYYKYDTQRKFKDDLGSDGSIMKRTFFYKGQPDGDMKIYDSSGRLESITTFENGREISKTEFPRNTSIDIRDSSIKLFKDNNIPGGAKK